MPQPAKKSSTATVAKKKSGKKEGIGIKYSDKSAGQPGLVPIFESIKKMMLPYEKGDLKLRGGKNGQIALVSEKEVVVNGKKRDEMWFAAALIQKGYVGFYYMPIYGNMKLKEIFKPELLKCLKGKSCFHIKNDDPEILSQIKDALRIGYHCYKDLGWV